MSSKSDIADAISYGAVIGVFAEILPPLAALAALVWTGIRIYEYGRVRWFGQPERKSNLHK